MQNNYADRERVHKEFQVGDKVFLKVKGIKISMRLGKYKRLQARIRGPLVLNRIGLLAYELSLPPMIKIHNAFHVLLLNKYVYGPNHIINWSVIQVEPKG